MSIVIDAERLGKKYTLRHQRQGRYISLRDVIAESSKKWAGRVARPFSRRETSAQSSEEFWALKDVSFQIREGDRVGIIGRNGAGKSTLLKILSRITEPTEGRALIDGRIASLLEVGTGFHPELTGRENIFLNGAIMGMRKEEIKRKFDEIVAFAEVERFLDTPVKRYSSGMYVRLAFAVAAHLEPEILLVDEVLAVGDAAFQKKCLGKMEEVGRNGRTVLFVSHNMNAVEHLCTHAMLIDKGNIKCYEQDVRAVIKKYLFDEESEIKSSIWNNSGKEFNNPWFKPKKLFISDMHGKSRALPLSNESDIFIQIEGVVEINDPALNIGYAVYSDEGTLLYWSCHTDLAENNWPKLNKGYNILRSKIPKRFLNEGAYKIELIASLHYRQWLCEPTINAPSICLIIQGGLSDSPYWIAKRPGLMAPAIEWKTILDE